MNELEDLKRKINELEAKIEKELIKVEEQKKMYKEELRSGLIVSVVMLICILIICVCSVVEPYLLSLVFDNPPYQKVI